MSDDNTRSRPHPQLVGILATLVAVSLGVGVWHAAGYFFVFDDFALVEYARTKTLSEIFVTPLFGFYRPLVFVATKLQWVFAGWHAPWAYAAGSLLIHYVNAVLVARLAKRLGMDNTAAWTAGGVFLCSAWAGEALFWVSARFDLLAGLGVLGALLLGLRAERAATAGTAVPWALATGLAAGTALWSKEVAVVVPALLLIVFGIPWTLSGARRVGAVLAMIVVTGTLAVYMWQREQLLPGLAGGYGPMATLLTEANLWSNVGAQLLRLISPPIPTQTVTPLAWLGIGAGITAMVSLLLNAAGARPRLTMQLALALAVCLLPGLWTNLELVGTGKSRFLYLPGIWLSLWLGVGASAAFTPRARSRWWHGGLRIAVVVAVAGLSLNLVSGARAWRTAATLSRTSIDRVGQRAAPGERIFVPQLPWVLEAGPPVLQEYAFAYYLGAKAPVVRGRYMTLRPVGDRFEFVGWRDQNTAAAEARDGERVVSIELPISGVPSGQIELEGGIVEPTPGSTVDPTFTISGWAVDRAFGADTGINTLHIWAHPLPPSREKPIFLGVPTYGEPRPDVASSLGEKYLKSGFSMTVSTLKSGRYRLTVHPHLKTTAKFGRAFTITVMVR